MKNVRMLALLTLVNLGVLIFLLLNQVRPVQASGSPTLLRGTGLQIVDAQGKVRASIQIVPAGPARRADGSPVNDGKIYPEAVLFRLIRPDGRPSVKIETSEQGMTVSANHRFSYTAFHSSPCLFSRKVQG